MSRVQLVSAFALLLLFSGCRGDDDNLGEDAEGALAVGQAEVQETATRGVSPGGRTLVLSGFNGHVQLSGSDEQTAQLTFVKRARGRDDAAARAALADVRIGESGADNAYTFTMESDNPERSAVDVRGTVPVGSSLRIELGTGRIELSAIDGPLAVQNRNGGIRVAGISQSAEIETVNGDVEVGMQLVPSDGAINIATQNGDIIFTAPADASARVEATTSTGTIRVEGLSFSSRRLDQRTVGAQFRGQLGDGNAEIELTTQNGMIVLREGRVLTLPASDTLVGDPEDAIRQLDTLAAPRSPADSLERADPEAQDTSVLQDSPQQDPLDEPPQ